MRAFHTRTGACTHKHAQAGVGTRGRPGEPRRGRGRVRHRGGPRLLDHQELVVRPRPSPHTRPPRMCTGPTPARSTPTPPPARLKSWHPAPACTTGGREGVGLYSVGGKSGSCGPQELCVGGQRLLQDQARSQYVRHRHLRLLPRPRGLGPAWPPATPLEASRSSPVRVPAVKAGSLRDWIH